MKKLGSELLVDRNFKHGEANSGTVNHLQGFFYNSKFGYNGKFDSKEVVNYRITIVFLVWPERQLKNQNTRSNHIHTDG